MTPGRAFRTPGARTFALVGLGAAFVVGVDLTRWIRPGPLLDPDPRWAFPRLLLGLLLLAAASSAGVLFGAALRSLSRTRLLFSPLEPLPLPRGGLRALAAAALLAGLALRASFVATLPIPFLEDEVNLIGPALALTGTPADFADAIVPIPLGRPDPHEMIGVAYLELLRASLSRFGTTIMGLRFPSLLGGALSLATAGLLGRALLPRGGGAAAVLVLAGLRWHAILSLTGWQSVLLLPVVDTATLLLLRARRHRGWLAAAAGGSVAGVGPHFYLASWAAAAALAAFAVWPKAEGGESPRRRLLAFGAGFALAVSPLFLLQEGRRSPYFGRASRHSVWREMGYQKSLLPAFSAAADALPAPWLLPEPEARHDLTDRSRLGWIVGPLVALGFARALVAPGEELSGLLLLQAASAGVAAVAGGTAGHPNGFRFGYLASLTAVAAAAGLLSVVGLFAPGRRRAAALAGLGLVAVGGAVGLRETLVDWPLRRATFDSFRGEDTLIGRAAARWDRYGSLAVAPGLGRSDLTIDTVRRYRLDPAKPGDGAEASGPARRKLRVAGRGSAPASGERVVERVRDAWDREWAVVLARPATPR